MGVTVYTYTIATDIASATFDYERMTVEIHSAPAPISTLIMGVSDLGTGDIVIFFEDALSVPDKSALDALVYAHPAPVSDNVANTSIIPAQVLTGDPAPSIGETVGAQPGSLMVNAAGDSVWVCLDNTAGSAIWKALAIEGGPSVVDHSDLLDLGSDDHLQYLNRSGVRAMTGNLDMGGQSITNVNLVDNVDVSSHASRHLENGADEIDAADLGSGAVTPATSNWVLAANGSGGCNWVDPATLPAMAAHFQTWHKTTDASTTDSSANGVSYHSVTTTSVPAGTYICQVYFCGGNDTALKQIDFHFEIDGSDAMDSHSVMTVANPDDRVPFATHSIKTFVSPGTHTIDVRYSRNVPPSAGTALAYESRISFWRVA